ncbi:hypothetical protein D3C87_2079430 [compost metagenome]
MIITLRSDVAPQASVTASHTSLENASSVAVNVSGLYCMITSVSGISAARVFTSRTASTAMAFTSSLLILNTTSLNVGEIAL